MQLIEHHNLSFMLWKLNFLVFLDRCLKELNKWEELIYVGSQSDNPDPFLVLEYAWRQPNWNAMKEALEQVII